MMEKTTLVIGASTNPDRFSYKAIRSLVAHSFPVCAIGIREGQVHGIGIHKPFPDLPPIHTVTMYVGKKTQPEYYNYILGLKPARVIFNPGTENKEFEMNLAGQGIEVVQDCTLVMLARGVY
jgi:predicted CoA-binding protein